MSLWGRNCICVTRKIFPYCKWFEFLISSSKSPLCHGTSFMNRNLGKSSLFGYLGVVPYWVGINLESVEVPLCQPYLWRLCTILDGIPHFRSTKFEGNGSVSLPLTCFCILWHMLAHGDRGGSGASPWIVFDCFYTYQPPGEFCCLSPSWQSSWAQKGCEDKIAMSFII